MTHVEAVLSARALMLDMVRRMDKAISECPRVNLPKQFRLRRNRRKISRLFEYTELCLNVVTGDSIGLYDR